LIKRLSVIFLLILLIGSPFFVHTLPRTFAGTQSLVRLGTTDIVETSLDPANAYDSFSWEILQNLGSGLICFIPGATGSPSDFRPALATSWNVSNDGMEWSFDLRRGVKYSDGSEFNAADVKYTFDREMGIADPNGPFLGVGFSDIVQNVTVVDNYKVSFNLKYSFGAFLSLLASPECVMVDPKYAPLNGTSWTTNDIVRYTAGNARASYPLGLGPYFLVNWTRNAGKDLEMVLVANPNYWDAASGYPINAEVIIKFYADSASLASAVQTGEVDVALGQLSLSDVLSLKNNAGLRVLERPGAFIQYLCFQEKSWPFNETSIRRAVGAAINRSMIVNDVFSGEMHHELLSSIPSGMFGHSDAFLNLGDPNYTLTRELLAPYGFNETNKLIFNLFYETSGHYPQSPQQALTLKSSIEQSGVIFVNLQGLDWAAYGSARRFGSMQAFIMGWYPDYMDPHDYVSPFFDSTDSSWLHLGYVDPTMDSLILWARGNVSQSIRQSLYQQIQDLSVNDCVIVPLFQGNQYVVRSANVSGVSLDVSQSIRIWMISQVHPFLVGDVNLDGKVDIQDAILVAAAFGSSYGQVRWNAAADLNNDGIVDIYDIIMVASHFNQHSP